MYPVVVPLLAFPEYTYYILKGLCVSVGGITESIVKYSLGALTQFISAIAKDSKNASEVFNSIFESVIRILEEHAKEERIITPMFKTLDFMFEKSEILSWVKETSFGEKIFAIIVKEIKGTKSMTKIPAAVGLIVGLMNLQKEGMQEQILELEL